MRDPQAFCQAVMHEYERQWSCAGGHAVRHPLRLKMERLKEWCDQAPTLESFEEQLRRGQTSEDVGTALLAEELASLWHTVRAGGNLPFH